MRRPKGKLLALVAVFAAIGLAAGTGAFTTVTAERTADVNVAGDSSALLQIQAADTPNGDAYVESSDELSISLDGTRDATGINQNATTAVHDVVTITNQGSQPVHIALQRDGDQPGAVTFAVVNGSLSATDGESLNTVGITGADNAVPITADDSTDQNQAYELDAGESVTVGIYADTTDGNPLNEGYSSNNPVSADPLDSVTIIAANETSTIADQTSSNTVVEVSD